jgi:hypothetical protein
MDISYQTDVSKPNSLEDGIISCWTIGCSREDGPVRARSADLERGLFLFLSFLFSSLDLFCIAVSSEIWKNNTTHKFTPILAVHL